MASLLAHVHVFEEFVAMFRGSLHVELWLDEVIQPFVDIFSCLLELVEVLLG